MARITAENCNKVIPDRFRLVFLATRYAKLLNYKVEASQSKKEKRDKPPVISLRRIAAGKVSVEQLEQDLINSLRMKTMIEPLVNQDESEDIEEKFEYLPEVYIGEDYSDLDDQIFNDKTADNYEEEKYMLVGIGTDIVQIPRIEKILHLYPELFSKRILALKELRQLAKRFAAKEAVSKAFGVGIGQGINFKDIIILNDDLGKPLVNINSN